MYAPYRDCYCGSSYTCLEHITGRLRQDSSHDCFDDEGSDGYDLRRSDSRRSSAPRPSLPSPELVS